MTEQENVIELNTQVKRLPFRINGERFEAYKVPGISFMKLIGKLGKKETEAEQAAVMFEVFQSTMTKDEFGRFEEFASNPANGVDANVLFELISKLVEGSGDRPTEQPSSSASTTESERAGSEVPS